MEPKDADRKTPLSEKKMIDDSTFFHTILSALPSLVSYTDTDFVYRYVNPAYEKWFAVSLNDCIGKTIAHVVGDAGFQGAKPFLDRSR